MVTVGDARSPRALEAIRAPLRMVACIWLYDAHSRTLFTSDLFTHVTRAAATDSSTQADGESDRTRQRDVSDTLQAKFDFLERSSTSFFREGIAAIVDDRDVEIIAPAYGCVLTGRVVVERHVELVLGALAELDVDRRAMSS